MKHSYKQRKVAFMFKVEEKYNTNAQMTFRF